jgi:methyl coenzyme M reductase subunit C-like uncharacterized protein (methanogenesis marker protein 7)
MKSNHKKMLLKLIDENYHKSTDIKNIVDEVLKEQQKDFFNDPPIYLSRQPDVKRPDNVYITAKTCYPISFNKTIDFRVNVGRVEMFENIDEVEIKKTAKIKILNRLKSLANLKTTGGI